MRNKIRNRLISILLISLSFFSALNCDSNTENSEKSMLTVKEVIEKHDQDIMRIEGVVGLYESVFENGTPSITIMVIKKTEDLLNKLPDTLEGYPVVVEETGEIKPL